MIIDKKNKTWIIVTIALFVIATGAYFPYHMHSRNGVSGGSLMGLVYGIAGFAMMVVATLLGARKRLRTLRVGRTYYWMQAHVWLGLLSYPIILYHAGFSTGGALTLVLMILFTIVIVSGLFGIYMQNTIPTRMFREVPMETIYDQIPRIVEMIQSDAEGAMRSAIESAGRPDEFSVDAIAAGVNNRGGGTAVAVAAHPGVAVLEDYYNKEVRPFLAHTLPHTSKLLNPFQAEALFIEVSKLLPEPLRNSLDTMRRCVDERRQLALQQNLHRWLHLWLIIHVPLSYGLMLLAIIHIIGALKYTL